MKLPLKNHSQYPDNRLTISVTILIISLENQVSLAINT